MAGKRRINGSKGVANFITRSTFTGLEVQGDYNFIDGSDDNYSLSALAGFELGDTGNFVFGAKKDETRATGVLTVTVPGAPGAPTMKFTPARITEGIPELLEGSERDDAITSWQQLGEGCS